MLLKRTAVSAWSRRQVNKMPKAQKPLRYLDGRYYNIILQTCSCVSPAELLAHAVVAHLVDLAVLVVEADVLAELPVADLALGTLGVAGAGGGLAHATHHGGGVGDEGGRAGALRTVVHNLARGIRSACVPDAWIHAPRQKQNCKSLTINGRMYR